jgi:hypothetical protein
MSHADQLVSFNWVWLMLVALGGQLRLTVYIEHGALATRTELTTKENRVALTII